MVSLEGALSDLSLLGVDAAATSGQLVVSLRLTPLALRAPRRVAVAGRDGDGTSVGEDDDDPAAGVAFAAICSFLTAQKLGVVPCGELRPLRRPL